MGKYFPFDDLAGEAGSHERGYLNGFERRGLVQRFVEPLSHRTTSTLVGVAFLDVRLRQITHKMSGREVDETRVGLADDSRHLVDQNPGIQDGARVKSDRPCSAAVAEAEGMIQ